MSASKNICFIFNQSFFLGGGEVSFFELIRKIDYRFFKPIVIVPDVGEIKKKLKEINIQVYIVSFPPLKNVNIFIQLKALLKLIKILKRNGITILHINGSRACFYSSIAGRILKIPVIWHVRESISDLLFYDLLLASLSNFIICVSKSVQFKRFHKFGRKIRKKISVVYNGVDVNRFQKRTEKRNSARAQFQLLPSENLIGLVGNIIPRKAQHYFLKGFSKAKRIQPDIQAKVIIIGRFLDTKYKKYLEKLVCDLDLKSNVIFEEFSNDILHIFSALDIYVLSSESEGFCRSLLEAMSCGLPVIATRISEIEEAVVDKKNGILVDLYDNGQLASAIISLCTDKSLRNQIGATNRLLINQKFNLNSHAKSIQSLYSEII